MNSHEFDLYQSFNCAQICNKLLELDEFTSCNKLFTVIRGEDTVEVNCDLGTIFYCKKIIRYVPTDGLVVEVWDQPTIFRKGRWIIDLFPTKLNPSFEDLPSEYW